jgi:hypothetical protein
MGILDETRNVFDESHCPECQSMQTYIEGNTLICRSCGVHIIPQGLGCYIKILANPILEDAGLPVYVDFCACVKCGYRTSHDTEYVPSHSLERISFIGTEHLKRTCTRCGYIWSQACVSNEENLNASGINGAPKDGPGEPE